MLAPIVVSLLVACALAWGWRAAGGGRPGLAVAAVCWAAYAGYETLMFQRVLCSGDCNIRVDLLLIYPALLLGTLWGVASARRHGGRGGASRADRADGANDTGRAR